MAQKLTYTQLVVVRVSQENPDVVSRAAAVLREQLEEILPLWTKDISEELKPKLEVLPALGLADFPMIEGHPC